MSKRICSNCGKKNNLQGGKTYVRGYFICKDCVYTGIGFMGFGIALTFLPLCKKPLK